MPDAPQMRATGDAVLMPKSGQTSMRSLANSLPLKLLQAREAVMERFRPHLAAHDVTEQQWRVLRALAEAGEIDASRLADTICLLLPSLSRIIPDLEARGLVERRRAEGDRRTSLISLTKNGRALFDTMSKRSEAIYRDLEATLAAAGCAGILGELDRLIAALDAPRADSPAKSAPSRSTPKPAKV